MRTLIVQHVPKSDPPAFTVARHDPIQITPDSTGITPPERFGAKQLPGTDLRRELRWYLEQFLEYPFPPNTDRADRAVGVLEAWGTHAFEALFHGGMARDWYGHIVRDGAEHLQLRIIANEPTILTWPWEALHDPERGYLAHKCHIERQLNNVADPPPLHEKLPRDRLNILLVTARPFEADVEYRSISRALVEQIEEHRLAACVTILRPPTFDALREELARRPGYYHILHFDGHGGYGIIAENPDQATTLADAVNPYALQQGPQGCLVFETAEGKPHPIPAETLSATLHEFRIPMVVLNACQSGTIDEDAQSAFASVAASLIQAGIRSVVAMAWSLYVSGAQQFLPAFYKRLLETGNLAEPTRAGRMAMLTHPGRVCARGTHPLKDWLVPVVYQQQPADLSFVTQVHPAEKDGQTPPLPQEAMDAENPYGFFGRDAAILALERALLRDAPAVLIHGLGGVGKTTLARGFVQWLSQTEGLDAGCLWFTFDDIHAAEFVLHGIGTPIFGPQFITLSTDQKLTVLGKALCENRLIVVWDNFESASGNEAAGIDPLLPSNDLQLLRRFLQAIQGGRSKVLITSRSEESWLPTHLRYKLPLGGLTGESRWEFCTAILRNLGIQTDRSDPDLAALMDTLDGHPLLMRAVLPRLEGGRSAKSILSELQGNMTQPGASTDPTQQKVYATLRFVENGLPQDLRPLLIPLALHERFVDADYLEAMAKSANQTQVTRARIDCLLSALAAAGLVQGNGRTAIYELHPALIGFLRSTLLTQIKTADLEAWRRAFVGVMGSLAVSVRAREVHEQRTYFDIHGANFHVALALAETMSMDQYYLALAHSLATHARNTLNLDAAERLLKRLAEHRCIRGDSENESVILGNLGAIALERRDFTTAEEYILKSLEIRRRLGCDSDVADAYYNLGVVAESQRNLVTAEKWYLKSLEISEGLPSDPKVVACTYLNLGRISDERQDLAAAEEWYLKSLDISVEHDVKECMASTYVELGRLADLRQDLATAERWYLKGLDISERLGEQGSLARSLHGLGVVALRRQDFATAEQYWIESIQISEQQGDDCHVAGICCDLGNITLDRGDYEIAKRWISKSLEISERLGDEDNMGKAYGLFAVVAGRQEQFLESARWLIKSIQVLRSCSDARFADEHARNFAVLLRVASEPDKARMMDLWRAAGLGDLPKDIGNNSNDS